MKLVIYKSRSGKNIKLFYYIKNFLRLLTPTRLLTSRLDAVLKKAKEREDYDYIKKRVDYYNQLSSPCNLPEHALRLSDHKLPKREKVYFFDTYEYTRWFSSLFKWGYCPGDITFVPEYPSIVKSRPIHGNNVNSILMKLVKVRHFIFVKDTLPFAQKKDMAIFRGKVAGKASRKDFMHKFFHSEICDCGDVGQVADGLPEWQTKKKTIYEHLNYKFIMALEGYDVASNLKWVMSSNSIAVMPRPTYETWFMEGTLIPNYHYIEIAPDYSDLEEKLTYYVQHIDEAQQIIKNANAYVAQFRNKEREKLISLLVLEKYFAMTNQRRVMPVDEPNHSTTLSA